MTSQKTEKSVLIIDDSDDDVETTLRALKKAGIPLEKTHRCENGEEALDYLLQKDPMKPDRLTHIPQLILLDLNMPGKDGRKVLDEIRKDPSLKIIPVVIMTTSNNPKDVTECYTMGANSFIRKPVDLDDFYASIENLVQYWFKTVILPEGQNND